jgi:LuxR family maltose regulon positive regulatory protein
MQGHQDAAEFIKSFTGSHRFVMDYLMEEVLKRQSETVQNFLLQTSILERMCDPLCVAILRDSSVNGQETLEYLERANLFIIPLDNERHWYRYHHLFAELLQQRLRQSVGASARDVESRVNELHLRASQWHEENGLYFESFRHATAANDIDRAERLIAGDGIPRHFRGAVTAILNWLDTLPKTTLDARPALLHKHASLLLVSGQTAGVEEKLQAAEAALGGRDADDRIRNLIGGIAAARSVLALTRYQIGDMLAQSQRALEYLHPDNLSSRATANWMKGYAYFFMGNRAAARQALNEAIALSHAAGSAFVTITATIALGNVEESENQLHQAFDAYQRAAQLVGDQPLQVLYQEAYQGLARIHYEWNDLEAADRYGHQSLDCALMYDAVIDRFIICQVFLARLKLARGDARGAAEILAEADQTARQRNFTLRIPEVAAARVFVLIAQKNLTAATHLVEDHEIPASRARLLLAQGNPSAALAILEPLRLQMETRRLQDERLKLMTLQAVAHHANGEEDQALQILSDALALAEPGGFIRLFVDEGAPMAKLLSKLAARGVMPDYVGKLLSAFDSETRVSKGKVSYRPTQPLIEPLTERELEVLRLIAQGLSNQEITEKLFVALSTVKGHNLRIFAKLQVKSRTEAIARARELGLL